MSHDDYQDSKRVYLTGATFAALIMAAIRLADPPNYQKLRETWPGLFQEFWEHVSADHEKHKGNGGSPVGAVRSSNP